MEKEKEAAHVVEEQGRLVSKTGRSELVQTKEQLIGKVENMSHLDSASEGDSSK